MAQRFGKELGFYLDKLEGKRREPRNAIQPSATFQRKLHLLQPITNKQHLLKGPMAKLALELQQWLIGHQQGCEKLTWRFVEHSTNASTLYVRFTQGRQLQSELLSVSHLQLEQATLPADVLSVELNLIASAPWSAQSKDLFSANQGANNNGQNIGELVDTLSARLGPLACNKFTAIASTPQNTHGAFRRFYSQLGTQQITHIIKPAAPYGCYLSHTRLKPQSCSCYKGLSAFKASGGVIATREITTYRPTRAVRCAGFIAPALLLANRQVMSSIYAATLHSGA